MIRCPWPFLCIVGVLTVNETQAQWGTLRGRVEFEGELPAVKVLAKGGVPQLAAGNVILDDSLIVDEKSMGVANVAVWLTKKPAKIHPALAKPAKDVMELEVVNQIFDPHVLVLRTDQKLKLINRDGDATNVKAIPRRNTGFNHLLYPKGKDGDQKEWMPTASEKLPVTIDSNIYLWLRAQLVIVDHPYATVTDPEGNFEIEGIPVGQHEVSIWHERVGWLARDPARRTKGPTYTIQSNEVTEVPTITLKAEKLTR